MSLLFSATLLQAATGNMFDVIDAVDAFVAPPECRHGCMNWTAALNASEQAASFADPSLLPSLGARCAIPGNALHALTQPVAPVMTAMEAAAFYGPICPCRSGRRGHAVEFHTCTAPLFVPEQINLQLANSTTVVVSFVSHELSPPTAEPVARLGLASAGPPTATVSGVSHWYETSHLNGSKSCVEVTGSNRKCNVRNLTMHFIRFTSLEPRQKYTYQVRSGAGAGAGGVGGAWSRPYTFRAPYGHGTAAKNGGSNTTRVAIYGDMGSDAGNNMGNLRAGCASGAIDAVVHMGDHAYNMGNGNDYHGDAYMQAFQDVLAQCPWIPVIGNHESTMGEGKDKVDAGTEERYLNQTWGVIYGQDGAESETSTARTTATTSLGHLLTRSSFYGGGSHGAAPSRTSQWYSVDLGLIHFVMLDLDPGPPAVFSGAQAAWAAADLAAADANRANVPWIVVTSHFPMYSAIFRKAEYEHASAAWYGSEAAEYERTGDGTPWSATPHFETCEESGDPACKTVKDVVEESIATLGALLDQHHVDIYAAGHVHSYSTTWPIFGGNLTERSYLDPKGTVHVLEGNGGVPGTGHKHGQYLGNCSRSAPQEPEPPGFAMDLFRICGSGMNYGRLVTTNASVLTYEHVVNSDDHVADSWSIVKTHY